MQDVLARRTIYAHGSLGLPLAVIGYPLSIWIPAHYSGGLGISLAAVGTILMLARLTDVITDPIMGELSDRYRINVDGEHSRVQIDVWVHLDGDTTEYLSGILHVLAHLCTGVDRGIRVVDDRTDTATEVVEYTVVGSLEVIDKISATVVQRTAATGASSVAAQSNVVELYRPIGTSVTCRSIVHDQGNGRYGAHVSGH